jgi:hypothetical protein
MNKVNQDGQKQVGVNYGTVFFGKGFSAWGCCAAIAITTGVGITAIIIVLTLTTADVINTNTPSLLTAAASQPTPANPVSFEQPEVLPSNAECPYQAGAVWLSQSDIWYQWVDSVGILGGTLYDQYNIYVYNSLTGATTGAPIVSLPRNEWLNISQTPVYICIDSNSQIYSFVY